MKLDFIYVMEFDVQTSITHLIILLFIGFILKCKFWKFNNDMIPFIILAVSLFLNIHVYSKLSSIIIAGIIYGFMAIGIHQFAKSIRRMIQRKDLKKHGPRLISHRWKS